MKGKSVDIREVVFNNRSYTPIPLIVIVLILAEPTWTSFILGAFIALSGEFLRIWGVSHAGSATRTTSGAGGNELITSGPFAIIRNPLYLGNFFITIGFAIASWAWMPWMLLVVIVLFGLQYWLIVSLEEEYLSRHFGYMYQKYKNHVPRFFPRLSPWNDRQRRSGNWREAFRSERSTLTSFITFLVVLWARWRLFS